MLSEMRNMLVTNISIYTIIFSFPLTVMERKK